MENSFPLIPCPLISCRPPNSGEGSRKVVVNIYILEVPKGLHCARCCAGTKNRQSHSPHHFVHWAQSSATCQFVPWPLLEVAAEKQGVCRPSHTCCSAQSSPSPRTQYRIVLFGMLPNAALIVSLH